MNHFKDFLSYLKFERNLTKNTVNGYTRDLQLFFSFINGKDLLEIKTRDIRNFLTHSGEERENQPATIHRKICSLKAFYKFLKEGEIIQENPAEKIIYPKRRKSIPKFLSVEEVQKLLDLDKPLAHQAIIELIYATGCRIQELVNLNIEDVNFKELTLRITEGKGGKDRLVMMSPRAKKVLEKYLARELTEEKQIDQEIEPNYRSRKEKINYLKSINRYIHAETEKSIFIGRDGGRIGKRTIQAFVSKYGKLIGLHSYCHKLRHSMASHLTMGGLNIRVLQKLLGHSSLDTTAIYASVTMDHIKNEYADRFPIQ